MPPSKADAEMVALVKSANETHVSEWAAMRGELQLYRKAFATKFWKDAAKDGDVVKVETGDAATYIESYIAALFSRAPAVEIGPDLTRPTSKAAAKPAQVLVNKWLKRKPRRAAFERATRLALIYPMAFLRVKPSSSLRARRAIDRVDLVAVKPWNVILDTEAEDWESMRYIGHKYTLPLAEARQKFEKNRGKNGFEVLAGNRRTSYFEDGRAGVEMPTELRTVQIVEFYDLVRSQVIFWSPDFAGGERPIDVKPIPLTLPGTQLPAHPIIPLYYAYEPDEPVKGLSTLARFYDQIREKNLLRTFTASAVRRDARMFLAKKGALDDDAKAALASGKDGEVVEIEQDEHQTPLDKVIVPVPVPALSVNHGNYSADIESDLQRGSVLAPFTRGESSRTTATEIGVLAEYSASSIGRMARDRDEAIEGVALLFLAHLILMQPGELAVVDVTGEPVAVLGRDLDAEWEITALDQAGTPMSRAIDQQRFVTLVTQGVLQGLQIPHAMIVRHLVRLEVLPSEFADAVPDAPVAPAAPGAQPAGPALSPDEEEALLREAAGRSSVVREN